MNQSARHLAVTADYPYGAQACQEKWRGCRVRTPRSLAISPVRAAGDAISFWAIQVIGVLPG